MVGIPVPVLKTTTVELRWVQVRRIACLLCDEPFVYVYRGRVRDDADGVVLLSSDSAMDRKARERAVRSLGEEAVAPFAGRAACPHCGSLQPWMVVPAGRFAGKVATFAGAVVAGALGLAAIPLLDLRRTWWFREWRGAYWFGAVLVGMWLGHRIYVWAVSRPRRIEDENDPRAMTDEAFARWQAACAANDDDPARTWANRTGLSDPLDDGILSLGILDTLEESGGRED